MENTRNLWDQGRNIRKKLTANTSRFLFYSKNEFLNFIFLQKIM